MDQNHSLQLNIKCTNLRLIPTQNRCPNSWKNSKKTEGAFGENVHYMIDTLFYTKLPPHSKRSLKLAYLENGTYYQIAAHLVRDLELSDLANDGELSIPTSTAVPANDTSQKIEQSKTVCQYCIKTGHVIRDCCKRMKKEQEQRNDLSFPNTEPSTSKAIAPCPHCQRTNLLPEKCWKISNAANRPKRFKQDSSKSMRRSSG